MAPSQVGLQQGQGSGELCPSHMSVLFTAFPTSIHSEANGDSGSTEAAAKLWEVLLGSIFKKKKKRISYKSAFWPSPATVCLFEEVMSDEFVNACFLTCCCSMHLEAKRKVCMRSI